MPTPTGGYRAADGKRVPGTTTIIGRFKEAGGLVHWAWQLGMDGKDYREVRDEAAGAGTIAHEMVDCDIHGRSFDATKYPAEQVKIAENAFIAYLEWKQQTNLSPVVTEVPLVCECHRYGGTPDALLLSGRLSIGDWKTANAVYSDNLMQLAAYRHLVECNYPDKQITGGFHLLRFSKGGDSVDFEHRYWSDLADAWESFKLMRKLYDLDAVLKKRVR